MHFTLFEVLSHDERVIVFSNMGECVLITWNRSATLQAWIYLGVGRFEEFGIRTCAIEPKNYDEARIKAQRWFGEGIVDDS